MFKCGICGKEWNTVEERSKCEVDCLRTQILKQEEEKKRKAEEERKEAEKLLSKQYDEYVKSYKTFIANLDAYQSKYNKPFNFLNTTSASNKLYEGTIDASLVDFVKEMERMGWL